MIEPRENRQESRFPAPTLTQNSNGFTGLNLQIEEIEDLDPLGTLEKGFGNLLERNQRSRGMVLSCRAKDW